MNDFLLIDRDIQKAGEFLRPHYAIHSLSELGTFTNYVGLPDVTVSVLNNYLEED
jgi:hypothetical protein